MNLYKLEIDKYYALQTKDKTSLHAFQFKEKLLHCIPYWTRYIGTHNDYLYRGRTLDSFDKQHTAQIHVMIKHWNDFHKFAEERIKKEEYKKNEKEYIIDLEGLNQSLINWMTRLKLQ